MCIPITPFPADPICSERVTMHCIWGRKPPKLLLPLGISSPCRRRTEPRPEATRTEKLIKIARVVLEISRRTDRHTDIQADVLIAIPRNHRSVLNILDSLLANQIPAKGVVTIVCRIEIRKMAEY